jgi:hypothetical protein
MEVAGLAVFGRSDVAPDQMQRCPFLLHFGGLEFPTESVRSIKRVIVHARSVRDVEEISKA